MTAAAPALNKPTPPSNGPSRFWTELYGAIYFLTLVVFFAVAMVVLRPAIIAFRETNRRVESRITDIRDREQYLGALDRSIAAAEAMDAGTIQKINQTLPAEPKIPLLMLQIGQAATRNQLKIEALSFSQTKSAGTKTKASETANVIEVALTVHGKTYGDVKRFLSDVESSSRLLDVMGIAANGKPGDYSYAIQLRTYAYPETVAPRP